MQQHRSGYDWAGRTLALEFVEQLFHDGVSIEEIWAWNDLGFAPYPEQDSPCFTFSLAEIDACQERARRRT